MEQAVVLPFTIEPMTLADIPAVVEVERLSYAVNWPMRAFEYELQHNAFAHYLVLRTSLYAAPLSPATLLKKKEFNAADSQPLARNQAGALIGLAGFWLMADEAHISTIAVHPDWRGLGLGEWLLLTLLEKSQALGAKEATLEVRLSNSPALALYQKYGFEQVGRRSRYYSDNNEDALILTTPFFTLPEFQARLAQRKVTLFERLFKI